jgi:hypothetical protein
MIQERELTGKNKVFLTEDYFFSRQLDGKRSQIIVREGNMMFRNDDTLEYSETKSDNVVLNVIETQRVRFIVDVVSYKGMELQSMIIDRRLFFSENFIKFNPEYEVIKLYDQDDMMDLYFDHNICDFMYFHKFTNTRGVIGRNDIMSFLESLQSIEAEHTNIREEQLEFNNDNKIEEVMPVVNEQSKDLVDQKVILISPEELEKEVRDITDKELERFQQDYGRDLFSKLGLSENEEDFKQKNKKKQIKKNKEVVERIYDPSQDLIRLYGDDVQKLKLVSDKGGGFFSNSKASKRKKKKKKKKKKK